MTGQQPDPRAAARKLGSALRSLQQQSGRTLRSLEAQVRISDSSLSRYFRGETVPAWPVVRDLCRALNADPTEYRALWEAADPTRHDEPTVTADNRTSDSNEAAGSSTAPRPARRPRLLRPWSRRRIIATAAASVVAGGLVTGLLFLLPAQNKPGATPASGAAASTASSAGVLVHNVEKPCQKPRTNTCALSLAYNPYRPYNTTNSAGRVWHRDLLQAHCTIANGVTVTDENHKHTSIWIQVTHNGKHLWLPGIRVHPDHLTQLTTVLPLCTP
ncbi:helix-turn-helix domain-containing protein [Streptomyces sp. NPDC017966]|uniref:helix-turn-helix domain-containing protein n=1 Tax=Streptomyces sp. NPDC017966 TaxID=3365023 RepID=UPI0037B3BB81